MTVRGSLKTGRRILTYPADIGISQAVREFKPYHALPVKTFRFRNRISVLSVLNKRDISLSRLFSDILIKPYIHHVSRQVTANGYRILNTLPR
jgi:hypothetical protein